MDSRFGKVVYLIFIKFCVVGWLASSGVYFWRYSVFILVIFISGLFEVVCSLFREI